MHLNAKEGIVQLIKQDAWMLDVLKAARTLNLPDWWVCAGIVRSKIWDTLSGFTRRTPIADVDLIYFDSNQMNEDEEKKFEEQLNYLLPGVPWSVKNQARMHIVNGIPPYESAVDAIAKFPETVTALGVRLDKADEVILVAPHGIEDVVNFEVKPTPYFAETKERLQIYEQRLTKKNWSGTWPQVQVSK